LAYPRAFIVWCVLASAVPACAPKLDTEIGPFATLKITVRDGQGAAIPALVTLRNQDGSGRAIYSTMYSLSEVAPRVYGMVDSAALLDGTAKLPVPAGRWRLTVSHGPEYEIFTRDVEIADKKTLPLDVTLERSVDTTGYLTADLHVHAARSQDTTAPLDGRVATAAVVGLDVLGSADHNNETDYGPVIVAAGLEGRVASIVGNEISLDWAHFSGYPLPFKPDETLGGALPVDTLAADLSNPDQVFAYVHGQPTQAVVQVNHPRYENPPSYFFTYWLDPDTCTSPFQFNYDFDVVEVLNGIQVAEPYLSTVVGDWLCLVRTGHHVTATGNSDSHGLRGLTPGYPRNYVYTGDADASTFVEARFMQALREQRVVVSTAPFVSIESGAARIGDTVTATSGTLPLRVVVQAASWVSVDKVRVIVGGQVVTHELDVPADGRPRLDQTVDVPITADTFVVAIVYGEDLLRRDVVGDIDMPPFGFTNPIFVDADGDGVVTLPAPTPVAPLPSPHPSVVPPLRAFSTARRNDECTYELEPPPGP
jgi:hypothetical protein